MKPFSTTFLFQYATKDPRYTTVLNGTTQNQLRSIRLKSTQLTASLH